MAHCGLLYPCCSTSLCHQHQHRCCTFLLLSQDIRSALLKFFLSVESNQQASSGLIKSKGDGDAAGLGILKSLDPLATKLCTMAVVEKPDELVKFFINKLENWTEEQKEQEQPGAIAGEEKG